MSLYEYIFYIQIDDTVGIQALANRFEGNRS